MSHLLTFPFVRALHRSIYYGLKQSNIIAPYRKNYSMICVDNRPCYGGIRKIYADQPLYSGGYMNKVDYALVTINPIERRKEYKMRISIFLSHNSFAYTQILQKKKSIRTEIANVIDLHLINGLVEGQMDSIPLYHSLKINSSPSLELSDFNTFNPLFQEQTIKVNMSMILIPEED